MKKFLLLILFLFFPVLAFADNKCGDTILSKEFVFDEIAGAQTNIKLLTVDGNSRIIIRKIGVVASNSNSVDVPVRIGLTPGNLSAAETGGIEGVVLSAPGIAPGSGVLETSGDDILNVGDPDEDLVISSGEATGGFISVLVRYCIVRA